MSRLLMAAPSRLARELRYTRFNKFPIFNRHFAAKSTCKGAQEKKPPPKPGYFPSGGTHATFDDLPKPQGDFMKEWKAKNSRYNMALLSGIAAFVGTLFLCITSEDFRLYYDIPDYPYTEDEMEEFAKEEERREQEKEEREQRRQDRLDAKELKVRRRKAKEAMSREVELMQKDLDEGDLDEGEMAELIQLTQDREEFEAYEREELKRLAEQEKEREKIKKEKEKARQEQQKQRDKERKEREKGTA
ncbi:hypothetical protein AWZ03_011991 [Drosophila navojoa]|uniref:Deltamethrin resistance protein prag01 domain-containing protein n=1 Tax=Drosophila navojoa TaxID=7232 RepID=A0A484AY83_DRONA|nr:stress response protein NST1 [Drosophila navojoa]TDG41597.1 hypothetical protein AWZ03_011991 [Drosophila navojoa]